MQETDKRWESWKGEEGVFFFSRGDKTGEDEAEEGQPGDSGVITDCLLTCRAWSAGLGREYSKPTCRLC